MSCCKEAVMLNTEKRNPRTTHLDQMSTMEMVRVMNEENMVSVLAVDRALPQIAQAVDAVAAAFEKDGKLVYIGAGTSGRLGVLDASECPPTFGVDPRMVQGIIAGGYERLVSAGENAEDSYEAGVRDVEKRLMAGDVLVGISAAGGARYVVGALEKAKELGCVTVAVTSNADSAITQKADIAIVCDTGPEVLTGSTRLKAGNSQKFVLNMLTTCAMAKTGKVYENLMINLKPSNEKLRGRVIRITAAILDCSEKKAEALLEQNGWDIRKSVESVK
ncbi:MAG: N-acetylmuramic acid 6-phosphate etherase [Clostridia bacterium]|nr:N-acetylmuramic acid 6-phosphate etherase [Clostridia bacterium]